MKIRIKKRDTTREDIYATAKYLLEKGSVELIKPDPDKAAALLAARSYADGKPVREVNGHYWHIAAALRPTGVVRTNCGAFIRSPFLNLHPGPERCTFCYIDGYEGDGVE